ncbi:hypothetical protein VB712_06915 [Spirulina sp. CCNP1310]|uniref:hypothetical protein n=1 Tax=Spirulina sp. CCNP1310 TaxID=3110249 RepID=UPI002B1FDAD7|nr:hypothetical protein [Spirulina sp. CCNP1310]MEA5418954.1 hypothetical protein [Spirulina sp. CCNP1310]
MRVTNLALLSLLPLLPNFAAAAETGIVPEGAVFGTDDIAPETAPQTLALVDLEATRQTVQPSQPQVMNAAIEFADAPMALEWTEPVAAVELAPEPEVMFASPQPEAVALAQIPPESPTLAGDPVAAHGAEAIALASPQEPQAFAFADYQGLQPQTGAAALQGAAAPAPEAVALETTTEGTPEPLELAARDPNCDLENLQANARLDSPLYVAQAARCYRPQRIEAVEVPESKSFGSSPAMSIYIPVGYGADNNTIFLNANYQASVRPPADGSLFNGGIGVGLGDATNAVGVELSYAFANNDPFGEGGFNAKVHKRLADDWAIAAGWNGFLNIGRNDFEHSLYGAVTKVFRLQESLDEPLSRLSVTGGVGTNQFRSNGAVFAGENNINVFGNMALRVARPVSLIAEWTGQDLGLGLSIAPFRNFPLTITPAVRDVVSTEGRPARFVIGLGTAFRF